MAVQEDPKNRRPRSSKKAKRPLGILFWAAFFVLVAGLFLVNGELIRRTLENTHFAERILKRPASVQPLPPAGPEPEVPAAPAPAPVVQAPPVLPAPPAPAPPAPEPAAPQNSPAPPAVPPAVEPPSPAPARETPPAAPPRTAPAETTRDRALYFTQIDNNGTIVRIKVTRKLPSSDVPMQDVIHALLQGPTTEEQRRGIRTLIPPGSRLLSAVVRGNTAYISFNEDFQYTEYGAEGFAAQLGQIIWTVTEFSTVRDVQFLIEGRRTDYLGEGIWIGSPLNRSSL